MWQTFKGLFRSRKNQIAILASLTSAVAWLSTRYGLDLSPEACAGVAAAIEIKGLALIFGIAYEDGKAKGAGMAPVPPQVAGVSVVPVAPPASTNVAIAEAPAAVPS